MARGSGSAFRDKRTGKFYAVVSVGRGERIAKPCLLSTDLDDARQRASIAAELVNALREAHRDTSAIVETTVEECARVPLDKFDDVRAMVRAILGGALPVDSTPTRGNATPRSAGPTFGDVAKLWTSGDLRRQYPDVVEEVSAAYSADVASKLNRYVLPILRDVPIAAFTLDHALRVMSRVPATLSKSSRSQIAQHLRRVVSFAVYPLRYITANPIPPQFMPRQGRGRERNMLFTDEDRTLLHELRNPIELRILFGFMAREGMRREEACALEWRSVDLVRGWVYLDKNKTERPRDWPLDPGVAEALRRWRALNPKARYVFGGSEPVPMDALAATLRDCLKRAGVHRPQLHDVTDERMRAGTHDLRGTFVTLAIAQGKGEGWIRRRTGHTTSSMIERYRRNADNLAEGEAVALDPLWLAIPELHVHVPADDRADTSASRTVSSGGAASSIAAVYVDKSSDADPGFPGVGVPAFLSVEDMGIEPTASRVRFSTSAPHGPDSPSNRPARTGRVRAGRKGAATSPPAIATLLAGLGEDEIVALRAALMESN